MRKAVEILEKINDQGEECYCDYVTTYDGGSEEVYGGDISQACSDLKAFAEYSKFKFEDALG